MHGREVNPDFSPEGWKSARINSATPESVLKLIPAYTWCRAGFTLEKPGEEWFAPWKVNVQAERDALLYLNGKFVGRYVTEGPQEDFYLPEPYLNWGSRNMLTILLAYADNPGYIRTLRIRPYDEFATRRTRVEFEW
jgi:Beta-galactosidase second all-beta domain